MLKIKIIIMIFLLVIITGCKSYDINDDYSCYETICDKEYNVEYVVNSCGHRGGISIKLDNNGNVIHCNEKVE